MPFGFRLTADTLPSGVRESRLQVRLGCFRLSPACPFRLLPTSPPTPASEALPPLSDIAPLIRAPEGLQPSSTTRCSAHTTGLSDFPGSFIIGVRPQTSRCVPERPSFRANLGSPVSRARRFRSCSGSLTARDSAAPRDIGAPAVAFRFLLQRRRPGGSFFRGFHEEVRRCQGQGEGRLEKIGLPSALVDAPRLMGAGARCGPHRQGRRC